MKQLDILKKNIVESEQANGSSRNIGWYEDSSDSVLHGKLPG